MTDEEHRNNLLDDRVQSIWSGKDEQFTKQELICIYRKLSDKLRPSKKRVRSYAQKRKVKFTGTVRKRMALLSLIEHRGVINGPVAAGGPPAVAAAPAPAMMGGGAPAEAVEAAEEAVTGWLPASVPAPAAAAGSWGGAAAASASGLPAPAGPHHNAAPVGGSWGGAAAAASASGLPTQPRE